MSDEVTQPEISRTVTSAAPAGKKGPMQVPTDDSELPDLPWSVNPDLKGNLIERYGVEGGAEMYRRVAVRYGHFNPRNEPPGYRPDLHP